MSLGTKIKQLREAAGWTQAELATRSGLGRGYISRLETDDYNKPSADTFVRLASALKVSPDELHEAAGYIRRREMVPPPHNGLRPFYALLKEVQEHYELLETVEVPIVGSVPAGDPEPEEADFKGYISIPKEHLGSAVKSRLKALRVHGESLSGDNIHDGDLLIVDPDPDVTLHGQIFILRVYGEEVARHVYQEGDELRLVSSKGGYQEIDVKEADILGRVILSGTWRKH